MPFKLKLNLLAISLVINANLSVAQDYSMHWHRLEGEGIVTDIDIDDQGNSVIIITAHNSEIGYYPFSGATRNPSIVKFDAFGSLVWKKNLIGDARLKEIFVDSKSNIYIIGYCNPLHWYEPQVLNLDPGPNNQTVTEGSFICKYDSEGRLKWVRQFGSYHSTQIEHLTGNDEFLLLTGEISGTELFDSVEISTDGGTGSFIMKVNTAGDHIWHYVYSGYKAEYNEAGIDEDQNIYIYCTFEEIFDMDPTEGTDLKIENTPGYPDEGDKGIIKLNKDGKFLWAKQIVADSYKQVGDKLIVSKEGEIYLAGVFNGNLHFPGCPTITSKPIYDRNI
jgi:hypothetical protein